MFLSDHAAYFDELVSNITITTTDGINVNFTFDSDGDIGATGDIYTSSGVNYVVAQVNGLSGEDAYAGQLKAAMESANAGLQVIQVTQDGALLTLTHTTGAGGVISTTSGVLTIVQPAPHGYPAVGGLLDRSYLAGTAKNKTVISDRFSAPGGYEVSSRGWLDRPSETLSVYNALPWRNRAVRDTHNTDLTAHMGPYGSYSGSALSAAPGEAHTALTGSVHKINRNTDYDIKFTSTLQAYRTNSVYFGGSTSDLFYADDTNIDDLTRFTISAWFMLPDITTGANTSQVIWSFGSLGHGMKLGRDANNRFSFKARSFLASDPSTAVNFNWWFEAPGTGTTPWNPQINRWYHVVVSLDQGDNKEWRTSAVDYTDPANDRHVPRFWVDGKEVGWKFEAAGDFTDLTDKIIWNGFASTTVDVGDIAFGHSYKGSTAQGGNFLGYIQDVSVWNDVLTDAQVKQLYRLPGYDSAGPGDLNRLEYVSTRPEENKLHAWWQFNHATSITDLSPAGHGLTLTNNGSPAVNTTAGNFLPANYYTTECAESYDNYFVQHPIPANDYGYAWITASAAKDEGCDTLTTASFEVESDFKSFRTSAGLHLFGGSPQGIAAETGATALFPTTFNGLNFIIYEPVTASSNVLGYPSLEITDRFVDATDTYYHINYLNEGFHFGVGYRQAMEDAPHLVESRGAVLNSILLKRNGPYGYPTFKQIRTGESAIAREHKKRNIISMSDKLVTTTVYEGDSKRIFTPLKSPTFINYREPVLTIKSKAMVHNITSFAGGSGQDLSIRHTFGNNITKFSNFKLKDDADPRLRSLQVYDDIKDLYLAGDMPLASNPLKEFKSLIYGETIYPKGKNTFLSGSRGRTKYAETAATIASLKNGEYRTFWKDTLADRKKNDGALNSMGYKVFGDQNTATNADDIGWSWILGSGSLSIWPLDTGDGTREHIWVGTSKSGIPGSSSMDGAGTFIPVGDEYGGTWGELHRPPEGTIFGSCTTAQLNEINNVPAVGGGDHFMNDDKIKTNGTASACFFHWDNCTNDEPGLSYGYTQALVEYAINEKGYQGTQGARYATNYWAGRNPWFDSYEDYADDIRSMGKEYTIVPEFKISEHMEFYIKNGFKNTKNYKFLSLDGAEHSSSADAHTSDYNEKFWDEYCHSDFMEHFGLIQRDHEGVALPGAISLKCSAVKKLLPYDGFYPVQRTLQLASLFSSSYAPFISGSSSASYGLPQTNKINENGYDKNFAERLQSMLQPFYAPGIMYNSIKSGIGVDYAYHTSSAELMLLNASYTTGSSGEALHATITSSFSSHVITNNPDIRMPFEAIVNPDPYIPVSASLTYGIVENIDKNTAARLYLTAPYFGTSSFYANWNGNSLPHYSLAANNFFAEVPNFFLRNKTLTTYRSSPQSEWIPMASGTTYFMDVVMYKSPDMIVSEHGGQFQGIQGSSTVIRMYNRGWGFGPRYHVCADSKDFDGASSFDKHAKVNNAGDPAWAPHTPPYFYGNSVARLAFSPHIAVEMEEGTSMNFSIDDVISNAKIDPQTRYFSETPSDANNALSQSVGVLESNPSGPAYQSHMRITSSMNLFGKTSLPSVEFDAVTRLPLRARQDIDNQAWVMHTKWECPTLNFSTGKGGGLGPAESEALATPKDDWWQEKRIVTNRLARPLGIWQGYGEVPTGQTGVFVGLRESFPHEAYRNIGVTIDQQTGSLMQACGFRPEQRRLGDLALSKWISEAVVAIPFVEVEGRRKFFALGNTQKQSRQILLNAIAGNGGPGRSVRQMASRMPRYVFPPHLDFIKDPNIEPFAMYIFEFVHKLSREDLSNIWQNIMPDISVTAEKSSTVLMHPTGENEFFRGNPIPDHTRWMVFKVKRRAAKDYFKLTADSQDDHNYSFNFRQGTHKAVPDYTYNWPYDFFSLVELAKLDVSVGIGNDAFPVVPA